MDFQLLLFLLNFIFNFDSKFLRNTKNEKIREQEFKYHFDTEALNERKSQYPIHPIILSRRSLKEMSSEEMTNEELFSLFEAARWAPSSFNTQGWRFVYAKRNSFYWDNFLSLMSLKNQKWASDASVLLVLLSNMYNTYKGNKTLMRTHSFDCGTAFMAMALEASARGYVVHPMAGFDRKRAAEAVGVDDNPDYNVEIMIAIGKRPAPSQRSFIEKMTQRKSIHQFISEGVFSEKFQL